MLLVSVTGYSQNVTFEYDAAGNQILRQWCANCRMQSPNQPKDFSKVMDSDMEKFYPEDVISYYPNPVKEQLYLKWELIDNKKVSKIEFYDISGKYVNSIESFDSENSTILSFGNYPSGIYFVNLIYSNSEVKTIKIIKD
jgi:hypothetical protein